MQAIRFEDTEIAQYLEFKGGIFLRFRLVYILILSLLLSLESLEKFVWWWWVVVGGGAGCVNLF